LKVQNFVENLQILKKSAKSISSSIFNFEEELLKRKELKDSKLLSIYGQRQSSICHQQQSHQ